jgi:hypothetical protein
MVPTVKASLDKCRATLEQPYIQHESRRVVAMAVVPEVTMVVLVAAIVVIISIISIIAMVVLHPRRCQRMSCCCPGKANSSDVPRRYPDAVSA